MNGKKTEQKSDSQIVELVKQYWNDPNNNDIKITQRLTAIFLAEKTSSSLRELTPIEKTNHTISTLRLEYKRYLNFLINPKEDTYDSYESLKEQWIWKQFLFAIKNEEWGKKNIKGVSFGIDYLIETIVSGIALYPSRYRNGSFEIKYNDQTLSFDKLSSPQFIESCVNCFLEVLKHYHYYLFSAYIPDNNNEQNEKLPTNTQNKTVKLIPKLKEVTNENIFLILEWLEYAKRLPAMDRGFIYKVIATDKTQAGYILGFTIETALNHASQNPEKGISSTGFTKTGCAPLFAYQDRNSNGLLNITNPATRDGERVRTLEETIQNKITNAISNAFS